MAEADDTAGAPAQAPRVPTSELEAELESALADARRQLSLIRGNLASVAAFLTRPER